MFLGKSLQRHVDGIHTDNDLILYKKVFLPASLDRCTTIRFQGINLEAAVKSMKTITFIVITKQYWYQN